ASSFPPGPGRFDIDSEIMYYSTADYTNNLLTGVTRGVENTAAVAHAVGTAVEGQAYLQIVDPQLILDGQAIGTTPKAYFITFDMDYRATVSNQAALGVQIPTTSYFVVDAPK